MTNPLLAELFDGQVLQANPLATVMRDCIVIRDPVRQSHTIIALSELSGMKRITTTYPALLVISCGLLLIAAAAFYSKENNVIASFIALLGLAFAAGYLLSRRAPVLFHFLSGSIETANGSLSDAATVIRAARSAQGRVRE